MTKTTMMTSHRPALHDGHPPARPAVPPAARHLGALVPALAVVSPSLSPRMRTKTTSTTSPRMRRTSTMNKKTTRMLKKHRQRARREAATALAGRPRRARQPVPQPVSPRDPRPGLLAPPQGVRLATGAVEAALKTAREQAEQRPATASAGEVTKSRLSS
jgi:hypothetical protein